MSEINFKSVQHLHESLLQKQQHITEENQQEFIKEVREYLEQAKQAGSNIPSTRERDQVRANLRYWGNYIYSVDKTFPDTELAPSTVTEKRSLTPIIVVVAFILLIVLGGTQIFKTRPTSSQPTLTATPFPTETMIFEIPVTGGTAPVTEVITPTSVFVGSDVALTSPENGESVLPKIVFKGAYTNLEAGSTIHVLLVRSDRLYPIKDSFTVPQDTSTGEWEFPAALYLNPEELEKPENLAVVPAACFDNACRETLTNAVEIGLTIDELPSQFSFTLYRDSSRVVYRNAYQAITEPRLVYSYYDGTSYDLYATKLDGSDLVRITSTQEFSEMFPSLSPDGTKIVYIKRFRSSQNDPYIYALSVMDSNGAHYNEFLRGTDLLESPQWSPDSAYISYVVGDKSQSPTTYSLYLYDLSTKESKKISGDLKRLNNYRYYCWIPGSTNLVFNVGARETGTSGFAMINVNSAEAPTVFFDKSEEEFQPRVSIFGAGYLVTYVVINSDNFRDVYAVTDSDGQPPFDGTPVLLIKSTGELLDFPMTYPDTNSLYFARYGSIYQAEYQVNNGQLSLKTNTGAAGKVIIKAETIGDRVEPIYFDIGYMEAFFPIQ